MNDETKIKHKKYILNFLEELVELIKNDKTTVLNISREYYIEKLSDGILIDYVHIGQETVSITYIK